MRTSEHIDKLADALSGAQGEFTNPKKDKEVEVTPRKRDDGYQPPKYRFKYSTLDSIADMIRPILANHGLSFMQSPSVENGQIVLTSRLMHSSGEWVEEVLSATPENRGLQAMGSAITYLRRYSLTSMLGIVAEEDDDGNGAEGNAIDRPASPTPTRPPVNVSRGGKDATPTPTPIPALKKDDEDFPIWIDGFKQDFRQQKDYLAGRSYWEDHKLVLDNIKEKRPDLYDELAAWVKAESQKLPKGPS